MLIFHSFINQQSSWSHLQTSAEAVQKLLTAYAVSPIFLDGLYSFGAKVTGDDDPYYNLCEKQIQYLDDKMSSYDYGKRAV